VQTTAAPEGLAAIPPGPGLAAALHQLERASVPNDRILEVLRAQYRQLCHDQARIVVTIADIAEQHQRYDGHLRDIDSHPDHRLPAAALRRHTEIRDRTCTFTGCPGFSPFGDTSTAGSPTTPSRWLRRTRR
jgi:hypothetical protein